MILDLELNLISATSIAQSIYNTTKIPFINHMVGSCKELDLVMGHIHHLMFSLSTKIVALYTSGVHNWQADQIYRLKSKIQVAATSN